MTSTQTFFRTAPQPHTIILARGERVRHWEVRPAVLMAGVATASFLALGCLGAATLFFLSDDVASAFKAREGRTVAAYEERIASLREQVDSLTTRQFLDRDVVRSEVARLVDEQAVISARFTELTPLLNEARLSGIIEAEIPVPQARPQPASDGFTSAYAPAQASDDRFGQFGDSATAGAASSPLAAASELELGALRYEVLAHDVLPSIARALDDAADRQSADIARLTAFARSQTTRIEETLERTGVVLPSSAESGVGGPFVPFDETQVSGDVDRLADALHALADMRSAIRTLPIVHPAETGTQTSTFGVRNDPFLNRKALHGGLDFAAPAGTPVQAAAAGTVVSAGANGGYGQMIEIRHENGFATRYAHLSRIAVAEGESVAPGAIIGSVGSTGRSTGPHLHYEIRRDGSAIDPQRFIQAGSELATLL